MASRLAHSGLARERAGADQHAAAGDLLAAHPGEQPGPFDVDAGVGERRREVLGEVLQVVGHVFPGAGGQVQVVDLIDFTDRRESKVASDLR